MIMSKTVYVLVNEWTINSDYGIEISLFDTLSYAQEQMIANASCWYDDNINDECLWEHRDSDMSIVYYVDCCYELCHIRWFIVEKEINEDPEQLND